MWFFFDSVREFGVILEGLFCWIGGEDGCLCSWIEDNYVYERSMVWVFSGLVVKKVVCLK